MRGRKRSLTALLHDFSAINQRLTEVEERVRAADDSLKRGRAQLSEQLAEAGRIERDGIAVKAEIDNVEREFSGGPTSASDDEPAVELSFTGDVEGLMTFNEQLHDMWCDGSMLIISGPLAGEVTWNGVTGAVEGRFKIDCRADGSPPPTCVTKVMTARGSGDLEGVLFQFDVQPGWFPFDYTGRVLSR